MLNTANIIANADKESLVLSTKWDLELILAEGAALMPLASLKPEESNISLQPPIIRSSRNMQIPLSRMALKNDGVRY